MTDITLETKRKRMSKKKPAASTLLKAAQSEISDLKMQIEKLTKERDNEKSGQKTFYEKSARLEAELEQIHMLLDVLPGAAPRKSEDEDRWRQKEHSLMTRLASYLAVRPVWREPKHD